MNNRIIKTMLSIAVTFFVMVLISSCEKDATPKIIAADVASSHYENHGVEFKYPETWRISADIETEFNDTIVMISTEGDSRIYVTFFPKEKSGDLVKLVKTYDRQYYIPVFSKPKPVYQWSNISRNQHKGMRKTHNSLNPDLKPFIKEYFRFQIGDRTALVVMESNENEYNQYGKELVMILNTIKETN